MGDMTEEGAVSGEVEVRIRNWDGVSGVRLCRCAWSDVDALIAWLEQTGVFCEGMDEASEQITSQVVVTDRGAWVELIVGLEDGP